MIKKKTKEQEDKVIVINQGGKMMDEFDFLPNGIINKTETGIGATTLELLSKRHSIIVQPTRAIVFDKLKPIAFKGRDNKNAFGVHGGVTDEEIKDHLDKKNEFNKFVVVANSVNKLINILNEYDSVSLYEDYFFLVDEAEQYLTEASYRAEINDVFDHYFNFNIKCRAIMSATLYYRFSDPRMAAERLITIKYPAPTVRDISLIQTNSVYQCTANNLRLTNGNNLIFIDSINCILKIIALLKVNEKECAIYCSDNDESKIKAGVYYKEFTDKPAAKYNFYTSSYFSGIDIYEEFNIYTVINALNPQTMIAPSKLMQIRGRAREKCLSDNIIFSYNYKNRNNYNETKSDFLTDAKNALELSNSEHYKNLRNSLLESFLSSALNGVAYLRKDINGECVINYNAIDCKCINDRSKNDLYANNTGLHKYLRDLGHKINNSNDISVISDEDKQVLKDMTNKTKTEKKNKMEKVVKMIQSYPSYIDTEDLYGPSVSDLKNDLEGDDLEMLNSYLKYGDINAIIESEGDIKKLHKYNAENNFHKLPETHPSKKLMNDTFLDKRLNSTQIMELIKKNMGEEGVFINLNSKAAFVKNLRLFYTLDSTTVLKKRSYKITCKKIVTHKQAA